MSEVRVTTYDGTTIDAETVESRITAHDGGPGPAGADGADGAPGSDGASAYEVAVADGFVGTEAEWLESLVGPPGADGADGAPGSAASANLLGLNQQPVKTSIVNIVSYPAAGGTTTLHTITGAGVGISHQMTHSLKSYAKLGRLQYFIDGELLPSIDIEVGTLFGIQDNAFTTVGNLLFNNHLSVSLTGSAGTYDDTSSTTLLLPIPYSTSLVIKFYNPSATGTGTMFSCLQYREGEQEGLTDTYRLKSRAVSANSLTGVLNTRMSLFDAEHIEGSLVYFATFVNGSTNYSFLERPWNVHVDGESTPSYRGNSEDWWGSGFYLGDMDRFSSPNAVVTVANDSFDFAGGVDLLSMTGGIPFSDGVAMTFGAPDEVKPGVTESTAFTMGFAALYYKRIGETPTVPNPPVSVSAASGDSQAVVSFAAPAQDGDSPITNFTVTASPGGATASGLTSPLVVSGLTNGTAYTFTVKATNAIGQSAASAASNSVTPASASFIATDNFNRADAATLGVTPVGGKTWTLLSPEGAVPTGNIVSNQAKLIFGSASTRPHAIINAGVANYDVSIKIATLGSSPQFPALITRYQDSTHYLLFQYDAQTATATRYAMFRRNGISTYTLIGNTSGVTPAAGDVLRVVANGSSIQAYVNGALAFSITETNYQTATSVGFAAGGASTANTSVFDDFSCVVP